MRVPTVIIETENGPVVIDKSEFNPELHKLADPGAAAVIVEPVIPGAVTPAQVDLGSILAAPVAAALAGSIPAVTDPPANTSTAPAADAKPIVAQFGDRYFITNATYEKLSGKGISPTGYATSDKAWEAVGKL